jgi:DNA polymerase III epsilon subunit-like protein
MEAFISVDVEASGPIPGEYSLLAIGACVVGTPEDTFYVELTPITSNAVPEALAVARLDPARLAAEGAEPAQAMADFAAWLACVTPAGRRPVFVAYPLAFDWMFVAYYFHRFLGHNPFGVGGVDIESYYAGRFGASWPPPGQDVIEPAFLEGIALCHHAREDAVAQAALFARLLARHTGGVDP